MSRSTSSEHYKLETSYEAVRRMLLVGRYADRLDKPLVYWALPNDRRLPLVLLDRTLADLLACPFEEISNTPGIGQKKMGAMIKLLLRAARDKTPAVPFGISELADHTNLDGVGVNDPITGFDASMVSESQWERWKEAIVRHQFESVPLGRLAPALTSLPTVIWNTPLRFYLEYSLAEIRALKTHGEKRISVVLEVFHVVYEFLRDAKPVRHLRVQLVPKFAATVEQWIDEALGREQPVSAADIRKHVTAPLLAQVKVDLGESVHRLAEGRLSARSSQAVREQSRRLGVTRARVYQMLDECNMAMAVRWPRGRCLLTLLVERLQSGAAPQEEALEALLPTRELFYPAKLQRGAAATDEVE
ncbi:MAG: hypothetical protein KDA41_14320 [Planctomycetales bacterium]|nr:hypothetical protein [Planctomycetales bacterium]